jgi:subtilisin family serine protease
MMQRYFFLVSIFLLFLQLAVCRSLFPEMLEFSGYTLNVEPGICWTYQKPTKANDDMRYIVSFTSYHPRQEHLKNVIEIIGPGGWSEIERRNPARNFDTDFLVLQFDATSKTSLHKLLAVDPRVKYITKDNKFTRETQIHFPNNFNSSGPQDFTHNSLKKSNVLLERIAKQKKKLFYDPLNFLPPRRFRMMGSYYMDNSDEYLSDFESAFDSYDELDWMNFELDPDSARLSRHLLGQSDITATMGAEAIWKEGFSGQGIRVAVFDTGLQEDHPHFKHVVERTNWTSEQTLDDKLGHGTFVAGIIGSSASECKGFAPEASMYIFRVFTSEQASFTSWFLDAFNYAIHRKVHVLNLSIGGPDFNDMPFVDKVREMSANKIIVVSAIGNDGPLFGTLQNPGDQPDVIGVGGIAFDDTMASFSARGMTTWELPYGYGRVKPDVVAYSKSLTGSKVGGGCRQLSGTSVASPVVAGIVTLLASTVPVGQRGKLLNPAMLKQVLVESATAVPKTTLFAQGAGKVNLLKARELVAAFEPHVSVVPAALDLTDCPLMWPWCAQPLFHSSLPLLLNLTVLNSQDVSARMLAPEWREHPRAGDRDYAPLLTVRFQTPELLWPWSGFLGVAVTVARPLAEPRVVAGVIVVRVAGPDGHVSTAEVTLRVALVPTPPREKRVLWDQFRSLGYPSGYFPRDNLAITSDILDWNGDHPHTNFKAVFEHLRKEGFFLEVLGGHYGCFNASLYGTLLIVDPEEEFYPFEIAKLREDILVGGLSVLVFAEWYSLPIMKSLGFYDENTKRNWKPETGGANLPALNELLADLGVAFGDRVFKGAVELSHGSVSYASGTCLTHFPQGGFLLSAKLEDATLDGDVLHKQTYAVPILGAYDTRLGFPKFASAGRVAVFGDSSCLDDSHRATNCNKLLSQLLAYTMLGQRDADLLPDSLQLKVAYKSKTAKQPERNLQSELYKYSRVLSDQPTRCSLFHSPSEFAVKDAGSISKDLPALVNNRTRVAAGREEPRNRSLEAGAGVREGAGAGEGSSHLLPHAQGGFHEEPMRDAAGPLGVAWALLAFGALVVCGFLAFMCSSRRSESVGPASPRTIHTQ